MENYEKLLEKEIQFKEEIFGQYESGNPWHNASKELPPEGVKVVCRICTNSYVAFMTDYVDDNGGWHFFNNTEKFKITHWIPCPNDEE